MEDHVVEQAAPELERPRAERNERKRDVLVECRVEPQHGVTADRAVVANDCFAVPEPTHEQCKVLHLGGGDRLDAVGLEHRSDAAADAEREAAASEPMHRCGVRSRDHRVPRVVVGGSSDDVDLGRHRTRRAGQRGGLLDVEPLRDERSAESDALGFDDLVDEVAWGLRSPSQCVEPEVRMPRCHTRTVIRP